MDKETADPKFWGLRFLQLRTGLVPIRLVPCPTRYRSPGGNRKFFELLNILSFVGAMKIARNVPVSGQHIEWYGPFPAPSLRELAARKG